MAERHGTRRASLPKRHPEDVIPGVISLQEIYTITEAKARLGWSDAALRAARRRGLNVLACGKRRYVTGQEILRFLETQQIDHNQ